MDYDPYSPPASLVQETSAKEPTIPIPEVSFGPIVEASFGLWSRLLGPLVVLLLIPQLVEILIEWGPVFLAGENSTGEDSSAFSAGKTVITTLLYVPLSLAADAGCLLIAHSRTVGSLVHPTPLQALRVGFAHIFNLIGFYFAFGFVTVLLAIPAALGTLVHPSFAVLLGALGAVGFIWISARWFVVTPIIVLEDCAITRATRRSARMAQSHMKTIIALTIVFVGGTMLVNLALGYSSTIAMTWFELSPLPAAIAQIALAYPMFILAGALVSTMRVVVYRALPSEARDSSPTAAVIPDASMVKLATFQTRLLAQTFAQLLGDQSIEADIRGGATTMPLVPGQYSASLEASVYVDSRRLEEARQLFEQWKSALLVNGQ